MQTPYSSLPIPWQHPLFTRRMVQASCDVVFDFDWLAVIGHNQPKFPGLHDLSLAVAEFAKTCGGPLCCYLATKLMWPSTN